MLYLGFLINKTKPKYFFKVVFSLTYNDEHMILDLHVNTHTMFLHQ